MRQEQHCSMEKHKHHKPDGAQHIAGGAANHAAQGQPAELAGQLGGKGTGNQRGQQVADGIAAGFAKQNSGAALHTGHNGNTHSGQQQVNQLAGGTPYGAKHGARHVHGKQCQIDRHAPRHRDSQLAANSGQGGKQGAAHHLVQAGVGSSCIHDNFPHSL